MDGSAGTAAQEPREFVRAAPVPARRAEPSKQVERRKMDILSAEAKLVGWVGEAAGTEPVFRGSLPPGVRSGFELRLVSGIPAGPRRVNEFTALIKGISPDRNALWSAFRTLFAALPLEKHDGLLYVDVGGEVRFGAEEREGLLLHTGCVELKVSFI